MSLEASATHSHCAAEEHYEHNFGPSVHAAGCIVSQRRTRNYDLEALHNTIYNPIIQYIPKYIVPTSPRALRNHLNVGSYYIYRVYSKENSWKVCS